MSTNPLPAAPSLDEVARAWHAFSDEAMDAIAFDGPGCTCRNSAPQLRDVFALFTGPTPC